VKAVVAAFNQEKALVGAFSVITNLRMELFEALAAAQPADLLYIFLGSDQNLSHSCVKFNRFYILSEIF